MAHYNLPIYDQWSAFQSAVDENSCITLVTDRYSLAQHVSMSIMVDNTLAQPHCIYGFQASTTALKWKSSLLSQILLSSIKNQIYFFGQFKELVFWYFMTFDLKRTLTKCHDNHA